MINLSIIIPTYNRCSLLKQTLSRVLQEKTDTVEIIVTDNDSEDGTKEYLKSVSDKIKTITQNENIGADANMLSGLKEATGEYVWLLCDDDIPCSNAVPQILEGIHANPTSGLISLQAISSDKEISNYSQEPVYTGWQVLNRDEYLKSVGDMVTFASIIVAKKSFIDFEFLTSLFGSYLVPAGLALQCAGISNEVMIPDKPLLYMRGGNAGGYDAYTVFSKNLHRLLDKAESFNYSRDALKSVYRGTLSGVMVYIISVWPITKKGVINLVQYSLIYKEFYTHVIPAFVAKIRKNYRVFLSRLYNYVFQSIKKPSCDYVIYCLNQIAASSWHRTFFGGQQNGSVKFPFYCHGSKYIKIGHNFHAGVGFRIEAWDCYQEIHYTPEIHIGDNVCANNNVHIGGISKISIGNNVLIGSNVLITDHTHGSCKMYDLLIPPVKRKLYSKGPVIIEDDVLIGENVCILSGCTIGKGAVLGAGAVVTSDIPSYSVAVGIPAKARLIK